MARCYTRCQNLPSPTGFVQICPGSPPNDKMQPVCNCERNTRQRRETTQRYHEFDGRRLVWSADYTSAGVPVEITRTRRPQRSARLRRLCPGSRRSTGHTGWRSSSRTYRGTATSDLLAMNRPAAWQHPPASRPLQRHV